MIDTLYVLVAASIACSILGSFLVLRNLSMMSDAISHSAVLGIAIAAVATRDITSPWMIIGAGLFGLLTVFAIETLIKSGLIKNDSAVGIIFPFFFSLGFIIISRFIRNMHLDVDCVLMGEILFVSYNKMHFLGYTMSKAFFNMMTMFFINLAFVVVFFKELKLNTFDQEYASLNGFSAAFLTYSLMGLVSITTVAAFDVVGAILVIGFTITPAVSAYMLTNKLKYTVALSVIIAALEAVVGYFVSIWLNFSMSGITAAVMGLVFLLILLFNKDGVIAQKRNRKKNKKQLLEFFILRHLNSHPDREESEYGINTMYRHLNRPQTQIESICKEMISSNKISIDKQKNIYCISEKGEKFYQELLRAYTM